MMDILSVILPKPGSIHLLPYQITPTAWKGQRTSWKGGEYKNLLNRQKLPLRSLGPLQKRMRFEFTTRSMGSPRT